MDRLHLIVVLVLALLASAALGAEDATLAEQVQRFADEATQRIAAPGTTRVAVEVGRLDPRLKLEPCAHVEPYLPAGTRLWGRAHLGLRCLDGPKRWSVYLPITVHVFGRALVAASALPAGRALAASDLVEAEVDLAAERDAPFPASKAASLVGRTLVRALDSGQALRAQQLRQRQWFAAGETVRIVAAGRGFAVATSGEALSPGIEGRSVRLRTEGGRIVSGLPVGEHEVEIEL